MSMPYSTFVDVVDRIKNANWSRQSERRSIVDAGAAGSTNLLIDPAAATGAAWELPFSLTGLAE
jgi:hypothetical protein